jgi:hypothetical protein
MPLGFFMLPSLLLLVMPAIRSPSKCKLYGCRKAAMQSSHSKKQLLRSVMQLFSTVTQLWQSIMSSYRAAQHSCCGARCSYQSARCSDRRADRREGATNRFGAANGEGLRAIQDSTACEQLRARLMTSDRGNARDGHPSAPQNLDRSHQPTAAGAHAARAQQHLNSYTTVPHSVRSVEFCVCCFRRWLAWNGRCWACGACLYASLYACPCVAH